MIIDDAEILGSAMMLGIITAWHNVWLRLGFRVFGDVVGLKTHCIH